jgi:hypothetical protein
MRELVCEQRGNLRSRSRRWEEDAPVDAKTSVAPDGERRVRAHERVRLQALDDGQVRALERRDGIEHPAKRGRARGRPSHYRDQAVCRLKDRHRCVVGGPRGRGESDRDGHDEQRDEWVSHTR